MSSRRHIFTLFLVLVLGGCSIGDVLHKNSGEGSIIPALRYIKYHDGTSAYEDISEGNPEIADEIKNTPVAQGPMKVDCHTMREIGVIVYRDNSWWHDFDYVVTWPETVETAAKHFTYEDRWSHGYLKGAARFREPLSDGLLTLSVTHRRQKIYSTGFEIVGC